MFTVIIKVQSTQFQLAYAAVGLFFSSCLWILWITSMNQVETEWWPVLPHLHLHTMPFITVFEYIYFNKLGSQQTDLHITEIDSDFLHLILRVCVEWTGCLVLCTWTNVSFTIVAEENCSEKESELSSTSLLVHHLAVILLTPTYKSIPT